MKKRKAGAKKPAKKPEKVSANGLTAMQEKFCREYADGCTGTEAATRAGYSEKTARQQASKLLTKVNILARVREVQVELVGQKAITKEMVLLELFDCMKKCKSPEPVMEWDEAERCLRPSGFWQYDSKGATRALELMGKELGMFRDDKTITVQKPVVISGADQLED